MAQLGQMLHPGSLVARLEALNGVAVIKPVDFEDAFPEWTQDAPKKSPINMYFADVLQVVEAFIV